METSTVNGDTGHATQQASKPSAAVVTAVANAEDVDETDLPPLFHAIDPDALDALFESSNDRTKSTRTTGSITFHYHGYEIFVTAHGSVDVTVQATE